MKILISLAFAACLICGCMGSGPVIPHADSPASVPSEAGPVLCRDGTTPPCNDRG
jgi:hypothetical protein